MRKIVKKILAILLALSVSFGVNIIGAAAETLTAETDTTAQILPDGSYCVPVSMTSELDTQGDQFTQDKYHSVLLQVAEGNMYVTMRVASMKGSRGDKEVKFLKENYSLEDIIVNPIYVNTDKEHWDKPEYWRDDVTEQLDDTYGYADFTFSIKDLSEPIILEYKQYPGETSSIYGVLCTLNYAQAVKLPEIKDGQYTWSYILDNSFSRGVRKTSRTNSQKETVAVSEDVYKIINNTVDVNITGGKAAATFQLTDYAKSLEGDKIFSVTQNTNATGSWYTFLIQQSNSAYSEVNIDENGSFEIDFDVSDYKDMVFGRVVKILYANNQNDNGDVDETRNKYLYGSLRLSETNVRSVTISDASSGAQFLTTTANVDPTDKLQLTEITDGSVYERWAAFLSGTSKYWRLYEIEAVKEDGTVYVPSNPGTLRIPVPEGWDGENTAVAYITPHGIERTGTQSINNIVVDSITLGTYALQDILTPDSTAEGLTDGVYSVNWYLQMASGSGTSMSDATFVKPSTMTVKGDTVRIEFVQQGIDIGALEYLSRALIKVDDGDFTPVTVEEYIKNDGTLLTERFNSGRQVYYPYIPRSYYIEVPKTHNGSYTMYFRIPIMDALGEPDVGGVGTADKTANLIIDYSTAVLKEGEEAQNAPIGEALTSEIEVAKDIRTHWEEYDPSAWNEVDFDSLLTAAEAAQNESDAAKRTAYDNLQTAINTLTDNYLSGKKYDEGSYISENIVLSDSIEGTAGNGKVNSAAFTVKDNDETDVTLNTSGISLLYYYDITAREFVQAESIKDSNGNITGFKYTLPPAYGVSSSQAPSVYTDIAIRYLSDGGTESHDCWLIMNDISSAPVTDKTSLAAALDEAGKISQGKKTDEAFAELQNVLSYATGVYENAYASQSEIDAAADALNKAIETFNNSGDIGPTKVPVPTKAPSPTETPVPTEAPVPTETPEPSVTPEPTVTPAAEKVVMYRLYNPNSGEHFYTADANERRDVIAAGWRDEGIGWTAPAAGNAVYRLYNPNAGDHHYTLSEEERDHLVSVGWRYEGIGWYSDVNETVPVYRQYNPNAVAGAHNFTTSKDENDYLASVGWREEGIGWYGVN